LEEFWRDVASSNNVLIKVKSRTGRYRRSDWYGRYNIPKPRILESTGEYSSKSKDYWEIHSIPKTGKARAKKYRELLNNDNVQAIITSASSSDAYESLYKRVKNKSPRAIVLNYKKYLIKDRDTKEWYL
tara:strand:- start:6 stop:392 length:387 start_codon:yes stop_codon:yes gene_type:complete